MLAALALMQGLLLGQAPMPQLTPAAPPTSALPPARVVSLGQPQVSVIQSADENLTEETTTALVEKAADPADSSSIFSRPFFSDRHGLSFLFGAGPGRFNIIDWESRPNADRLWWLGRWPACDEVQLHAHIGFNIHWWSGPISNDAKPAPDLPPRVYDLYLDWAWAQRWSERLTSEVRFRPGMYTDFRTTPPDSFRIPGWAVAVYRASDDVSLVGGVEYLDRNRYKIFPVAGLLWEPTPSWELRLVFPEPKVAFELSPQNHVWGYLAAEYGGGRWTYKTELGSSEGVEYSDVRVMFGIEWREDYLKHVPLLSDKSAAFVEVGYLFDRHLRFAGPTQDFEPTSTWMIRFGSVW